jgi:hypothetical protein
MEIRSNLYQIYFEYNIILALKIVNILDIFLVK